MKINTEMILALEPCEYRKENFLKFYKDFDGSLEDFFKLDKISFNYKIWVSLRFVDKNTRIKFAIKCAEYVLPIFEKVFKDDKRIRNCIEFLNSIDDFENLNDNQLELLRFHDDAASAAHSSANISACFTDAAAANAASAAVSAAAAASYAANESSYYVFYSDVYDAAVHAAESNNNTLQTQSTIFQFLLDLINEKKE